MTPIDVSKFLRSDRLKTIVATSLACMVWACGPKIGREFSCEDHFDIGAKALEKRSFQNAIEAFETVTLNFPGCDMVDDAQFMLGDAYFAQEDFITAAFEYQRVVEDFPLSPRVEEAKFKIAGCHAEDVLVSARDQGPTFDAIFYYRQYLQDYPSGRFAEEARERIIALRSKLAVKLLDTSRFYLRMDYYEASLIYVDEVRDRYPETTQSESALIVRAQVFMGQKKPTEAMGILKGIDRGTLPEDEHGNVDELIGELDEQLAAPQETN